VGLITKIDANGRILLPSSIRYWLDLRPGDEMAVDHLGDGTIILKKIEGLAYLAETGVREHGINDFVQG
jgi:AbrB family looped-hinge helix DNA binding protein